MKDKNWLRDLLVLPLVVGLVVAAISFLLPRILTRGRELSYTVDGPSNYLSDPAIGNVKVEINGLPVRDLFGYKIRLWNSGDTPLKDLPVALVFADPPQGFQILSVSHATTPSHEFGQIRDDPVQPLERRFVFALLNPRDQDVVSVLTSGRANAGVFAKAEGMALKHVITEAGRGWSDIFSLVAALVGVAASLVTTIFERTTLRRSIEGILTSRSSRRGPGGPRG